jgi:hypothetical protein
LSFAGCSRCGGSELAELTAIQGSVDRDFAPTQETWQPARQGAVFGVGDGLRTAKAARAELALRPGGRARVEEHTVLRFLNEKPEDGVELMQVEEGTVEIDSAAVEITLRVGDKIARIGQKSRVRIRAASAREAILDVIVGRIQIDSASASESEKSETVQAGSSIALGTVDEMHGANTNTANTDAEGEPTTKLADVQPPQPDRELDVEAEAATVIKPSNERESVALPRIERATFHVGKPPLFVAIPMPDCEEGARLKVSGKARPRELTAKAGQSSAIVELTAGTHKLVVACGKKQLAATSLRVVKDPGTLELPRSAPKIDVAADGRRYTVRYQNLLPSVSFSWPNAPAGPYTLTVSRKGKPPLTRSSPRPRVDFSSGELSEGEHTFSFQAAGNTAKPTVVRIAFDDSARVGFVSSPADGATGATTMQVSGGSLLRAEVSVDGQPVALDSHGRFSTSASPAPGRDTIAIRMSHPSTGVHYYIRRLDAAVR